MIERNELFIGGEWRMPCGSERFDVIDPSNETVHGSYILANAADVDNAVAIARSTFEAGQWSRTSLEERVAILQRFAEIAQDRDDELAEERTSESGAPISPRSAMVGLIKLSVELAIDVARNFQFSERREGPTGPVLVVHEPVGVVGAITPFNGWLMTPLGVLLPAFLAGCPVVLKPDQQIGLSSFALAEMFEAAGLPKGVLSVVPGDASVGRKLVEHRDVDKITFTGSSAVGKNIAAACGATMKRYLLELGGKSAAIVLDNYDLDAAIPVLVEGSMMGSGQACYGVRRILVSEKRHDDLVDRLDQAFGELVVGDAHDPATQIGPLARKAYRKRVLDYIEIGQREGAKVIRGGGIPDDQSKGWFVEPTIFVGVDNKMRIAQEEIFGPVVVVETYDDEADAIAQANDSTYGLCGTVFSNDVEHGVEVARQVRTGTFAVNRFGVSLAAPFGGFKNSGMGRKYGAEGFAEFTEIKSIALP